MAYITTEEVKVIRQNLKKAFPVKAGWKLSVTREHYSSVRVRVMQAPRVYDMQGHESVNHMWIKDHYGDSKKGQALQKMNEIIHAEHWDESDIMTDYFNCAFYVTMGIGKWDKDCIAV